MADSDSQPESNSSDMSACSRKGARRRAVSPSLTSCLCHDLPEVKVMWPQLATIVPGTDGHDAIAARGVDPGPHRPGNGGCIGAVDHDLEDRVHLLGKRGLSHSAKRRTKGVVGGSDHRLAAARADFAAATYHSAGEREDDARLSVHGIGRALRGRKDRSRGTPQNQEVSPADPFEHSEALLHQELAFHDGDPP